MHVAPHADSRVTRTVILLRTSAHGAMPPHCRLYAETNRGGGIACDGFKIRAKRNRQIEHKAFWKASPVRTTITVKIIHENTFAVNIQPWLWHSPSLALPPAGDVTQARKHTRLRGLATWDAATNICSEREMSGCKFVVRRRSLRSTRPFCYSARLHSRACAQNSS